jgi:LmbE family N-acetylglucosaminyl deacetylase
MNILAIGAHPDDIELQCAGTLALYAQAGHKVFMAIATNGNVGTPTLSPSEIAEIRHREQIESCSLIGAELVWMDFDDEWLFNDRATRTVFIDAIRQANPDVMIVHGQSDYHPDHRVSGQVAEDARIPSTIRLVSTLLPEIPAIPHLFFMDNPEGLAFEPEFHVDISDVMPTKREMLACHDSQNAWVSNVVGKAVDMVELMELNAARRGATAGVAFAEGFREVKSYPRMGDGKLLPGERN